MTKTQAVLFDFGSVLYNTPNPRWLPLLQKLLRVPDTNVLNMLRASPLESQFVMDYFTGQVKEQDVWEQFSRQWRMNPARLEWLRRSAYSPKRLNQELMKFLSDLRPRLRTAILTNAGSHFRESLGQVYRLEEYVDHLIVSAEEGIAKPDARLYHLAAQRLGVTPEEAVFVDDLPENVTGAQEAGMQAILYQNNAQTIRDLKSYL